METGVEENGTQVPALPWLSVRSLLFYNKHFLLLIASL